MGGKARAPRAECTLLGLARRSAPRRVGWRRSPAKRHPVALFRRPRQPPSPPSSPRCGMPDRPRLCDGGSGLVRRARSSRATQARGGMRFQMGRPSSPGWSPHSEAIGWLSRASCACPASHRGRISPALPQLIKPRPSVRPDADRAAPLASDIGPAIALILDAPGDNASTGVSRVTRRWGRGGEGAQRPARASGFRF